jgi:hypothetical protein
LRVKSPALPVCLTLPLLLAACTTGNNRIYQGDIAPENRNLLATFSDPGGAPPPTSDSATTTSLSRTNWKPTAVLVPSDGLASKPFYTKQHFYSKDTARERGESPTAVSALELGGDDHWTQFGESAASPLWAAWDFTRMIGWDLWTNPEWTEHIYPRPPYAPAPSTVQRYPYAKSGDSSEAAR